MLINGGNSYQSMRINSDKINQFISSSIDSQVTMMLELSNTLSTTSE